MWFLPKKHKSKVQNEAIEAQIHAIHSDTLNKIDTANANTKKLNDLIEDKDSGVTELIFLATGGGRRK